MPFFSLNSIKKKELEKKIVMVVEHTQNYSSDTMRVMMINAKMIRVCHKQLDLMKKIANCLNNKQTVIEAKH